MSVSQGGGVSISGSGGNDIEAIITGGLGFDERLRTFRSAAKESKDAIAALGDAKAKAAAVMEEAVAVKAAAEKQLGENRAVREELRAALADAERLKIDLAAKIEKIEAICRE